MKKFSAIILCLLMFVTFTFSGCAGFSINYVRYYNEVVATVGDTKITRFELLNAYSSYGQSYYVSQQGQEADDALSNTLDLLIDREILYQYALSHKDIYGLTEYQVNEAVQDIFDSLDSQMDSYIASAKAILGIKTSAEEEEESSEEETAYLYSDYVYSPRATVVDEIIYYTDDTMSEVSETATEYYRIDSKIQYIAEPEEAFEALINSTFLEDYTLTGIEEEILTKYFAHLESDNANVDRFSEIESKAVSLLATDLISYEYYLRDENGKAYNTNTHDLLIRFIKRNLDSQIKSAYLENIRTYYLVNEDLSVQELLDEFTDLIQISYAKYRNHEDSYKSALKSIGTEGDTILWHNSNLSDGTKFGYFAHTLLSFSDEQKTKISTLDKEKESGSLSDAEYNQRLMAIINETQVSVRDSQTGLVTDDVKTFGVIMSEYEAITKIANYNERLDAFIEFMFKYTGDTATLSAGMPYVVGTNGYSEMETAFTDEAVRLIEDGVVGEMSKVVNENSGSIDDLCVTSYGVHFLFYIGDVNSFDVPYSNYEGAYISKTNKAGAESSNLYYKIINPLTKETYFDMLFDKVYPANDTENYTSNTGYSNYEQNLITNAKNSIKVEKNATKIKGTKVS